MAKNISFKFYLLQQQIFFWTICFIGLEFFLYTSLQLKTQEKILAKTCLGLPTTKLLSFKCMVMCAWTIITGVKQLWMASNPLKKFSINLQTWKINTSLNFRIQVFTNKDFLGHCKHVTNISNNSFLAY